MKTQSLMLAALALAALAACGEEPAQKRQALDAPPSGILNRVTVLNADVLVIDGKRYHPRTPD